jgi:HEAT repeat protein
VNDVIPDESERPAPEETRQSTPFLVLQFFIFPMAIVAVCVTVFVVFGLIASESRGANDYLTEIRTGSANRRWQAAYELSKLLQTRKDKALTEPKFARELVAAYEASTTDDPRVRRYLALALGRLGDPQAVPALQKGAAVTGAEPASEAQLYAVWALGAIGDTRALPQLVELGSAEDAGLRKTAVHALGAFGQPQAQEALHRALKDAVNDVRWNAALALGRRGDRASAPVLVEMLDRSQLENATPGLDATEREGVILAALRSARTAPDPALTPFVEKLRDGDVSLKIREAARAALEAPVATSAR